MKKSGKILLATLTTFLILMGSLFTAFAENTAYEIDEIKMSIEVPDDMIAITRECSKDDVFFSTFGLDYDTTLNTLTTSDIYFEAMKTDGTLTLTVSMTTTDQSNAIESYSTLTEEELSNIQNSLRQSDTYKSCNTTVCNGITYFVLTENTKVNGEIVRARQYNTVINGDSYLISLKATPGQKLTSDDKALLDSIMQTVTIKEDGFFSKNSEVILAVGLTLIILALLVVLLVVLYKYFRNPARKNQAILHELAHEHQISKTTIIPRKKLYHLMSQEPFDDDYDFMKEYEPLQEIGVAEGASNKKHRSSKSKVRRKITVVNEPPINNMPVADVAEVVKNEAEFDGGTEYFSSLPEEKDMYSYSNVDNAVDDYSMAKREQARQRRRQQQQKPPAHPVVRVLKAIGMGIFNVFRFIFIGLWFIIIHIKYFITNVYRLIKRKNAQRKRKKLEEERKERQRQRRLAQQEAERLRRTQNENRGENDLIKVRTRGEVRTQSRDSYNRRPTTRPGRTTHSSRRY